MLHIYWTGPLLSAQLHLSVCVSKASDRWRAVGFSLRKVFSCSWECSSLGRHRREHTHGFAFSSSKSHTGERRGARKRTIRVVIQVFSFPAFLQWFSLDNMASARRLTVMSVLQTTLHKRGVDKLTRQATECSDCICCKAFEMHRMNVYFDRMLEDGIRIGWEPMLLLESTSALLNRSHK
jgi:hypothetical protein